VYRLKRPLADGRQVLVLRPTELLRRLAALVPPPRRHLVRFHGVFAPNASWRSEVVPHSPGLEEQPEVEQGLAAAAEAPTATEPGAPDGKKQARARSRLPWAELLLRVFREDVLARPAAFPLWRISA
jgi:hypothetical protein